MLVNMNYTNKKSGSNIFDDDDDIDMLMLALSGGIATSGVGGIVDAATGETNASNSGEIGQNIVYSIGYPALFGGMGYELGHTFSGDSKKNRADVIRDLSKVASAKDYKDELKKIMLEEGETAAKTYFANKKNDEPEEAINAKLNQMRKEGNRRRFAGAATGIGTGTLVALARMLNDEKNE